MAGRPKKVVEEVLNTDSSVEIDEEKEALKEQNAKMMKMLQEMQEKLDLMKSGQAPVIIQQDKGMSGKKIKCMNMLDHPLYVSTQPEGTGKIYAFMKYGQIQQIKYDDLVDIVTSYPNTLERGYLYILDKTVLDDLGLEDVYEKIVPKEKLDMIPYLRNESDLELLLAMDNIMFESNCNRVAELINANESIELKYLRRIKEERGIDIENLADNLKKREALVQ